MSLPTTPSDVISTFTLVTERRKTFKLIVYEITFTRRLGGTIDSRLCTAPALPNAELPRQTEAEHSLAAY